jgi:hypothetical protein
MHHEEFGDNFYYDELDLSHSQVKLTADPTHQKRIGAGAY